MGLPNIFMEVLLMKDEVIYRDQYVVITKRDKKVSVESLKAGMALQEFDKMIKNFPEINIINHMAIVEVLRRCPHRPVIFGEIRERISIEISGDKLRAYVTLCVKEEELDGPALKKEIVMELYNEGIVFGIKKSILFHKLVNHRELLIAEGITPVNGEDSVLKMYQSKEFKPEIKEDGRVDYYEMNLINRVGEGEWLGECTDPTKGIPGKTVTGETIPALPGKKYIPKYDKKSVRAIYENGITTLYSLVKGALHYQGETVYVSSLLEIAENVDYKTGNLDFDGFISVKGTVADNFTVAAEKDVEILGRLGVGSVREIESRRGSIFIKGGIAGKNKSIIKSTRDLYTKFISDATILCEGDVHVSSYCFNSNIVARQVIVDSPNGQIVGGNIQADMKVAAPFIGSTGEKRTLVSVRGFDRKKLKADMEQLQEKLVELKDNMVKEKQELFLYSHAAHADDEKNMDKYRDAMISYQESKDGLNGLQKELKTIIGYLKIKGEGEITIHKKVYPNTRLELKNQGLEIRRETLSACFYIQNGEIKEI